MNKKVSQSICGVIATHILIIGTIIPLSIIASGLSSNPNWGINRYLKTFFVTPKPNIKKDIDELFLQARSNTCGPASLAYLLNLYGFETSEDEISRLVEIKEVGVSMYDLVQAAKRLGLSAWGERQNYPALKRTTKPIIAFINNDHWVVVLDIENRFITLFDPALGYIKVRENIFQGVWDGYVMLVRAKPIPKFIME